MSQSFAMLGLSADLIRVVAEQGYSEPTPVQAQAIPVILEGRDVLAEHPHVSMIPAGVMFLTVLAVNLIGDRMRGWLDVRESQL